ncbi:FCD domain-containing protein [Shigella sonnei]
MEYAFHLAICQASHNQVLEFTLQSLTDLMFNSVFASVNNLYHRPPQKKPINRRHARSRRGVAAAAARRPARSTRSCANHEKNLHDIEFEAPPFASLAGAAAMERGELPGNLLFIHQ